MSIIVTQVNKFGIIFGSDSNITNAEVGEIDRAGKKIFEIPKLNAAMCIAGTYTVGGEMLDIWLPKFIIENQDNYGSLEDFTAILSKAFESQMLPKEKSNLSISHIAGYVNGHPEMWCLSNTELKENGHYTAGSSQFHCSEDLWGRDWGDNNLETSFLSSGLNYQMYVNSLTQGRVAFNIVRDYLDRYFISMFSSPNFKFRAPVSLKEHGLLVKVYVDMIDVMYRLSDYEPKEIGGETQLYMIPKPKYFDIK